MGESAFGSHAKGMKHRAYADASASCALRIPDHFALPRVESAVTSTSQSGSVDSSTGPAQMASSTGTAAASVSVTPPAGSFSTRNAHLKAETLWALNMVSKNYSFRSSEGSSKLFQAMFPDSAIAKDFSCAERKSSYLIAFGLAPYLQGQLRVRVKEACDYVLLFDESLNDRLQSKQMDVLVRLWDVNRVATRYYTSKFLGHAKASTLHEELYECCSELGLAGLHQLSMDGPNVNWKVHDLLSTDIERGTRRKLLDVGSCGLHVLHNSFRTGVSETDWDVEHTLICLYWLFKNAPARREDLNSATKSPIFPLKFCPHRWVENIPVAERALQIWPNVTAYVAAVRAGTVPTPKNKSFRAVAASVDNPLFLVHISVFLSIAKDVTPFLVKYQSDAPMLPFLATDLQAIIRDLLHRFVKKPILDNATTATKLLRIDLYDTAGHKQTASIDIGFAAEQLLKGLRSSKKISDRECLSVHLETKACLQAMVKKLIEKSPLGYPLVRSLSWMIPDQICQKPEVCTTHLKRCLGVLTDTGHIQVDKCDDVLKQFRLFARDVATDENFLSFSITKHRLDELLFRSMSKRDDLADLWRLTRTLLLLSHGQATVERGFSINSEAMAQNMAEHTLIGKRVVKDFIMNAGGRVEAIEITPGLLAAAASGRQQYSPYLDELKRREAQEKRGKKRVAQQDELEDLRAKKKRLDISIEALIKSADQYADDAEKTGKVSFIAQSNAHRRSAREKTAEVKAIEKKLSDIEQSLKSS